MLLLRHRLYTYTYTDTHTHTHTHIYIYIYIYTYIYSALSLLFTICTSISNYANYFNSSSSHDGRFPNMSSVSCQIHQGTFSVVHFLLTLDCYNRKNTVKVFDPPKQFSYMSHWNPFCHLLIVNMKSKFSKLTLPYIFVNQEILNPCNHNFSYFKSHKIYSELSLISLYRILYFIGLMSRVFVNGPGDRGSIPGRVIPKTQKMVLDFALLNIQHYEVRVKWGNPGKGVKASPTPRCSSYWKGSFRVTVD